MGWQDEYIASIEAPFRKQLAEKEAENVRLLGVLEKLKVLLPQGPLAAFKLVQDTLKQIHN